MYTILDLIVTEGNHVSSLSKSSGCNSTVTARKSYVQSRIGKLCIFFFQAEDGIRDWSDWSSDVCSSDLEHTSELQSLTNLVCRLLLGVQTCALDRKSVV